MSTEETTGTDIYVDHVPPGTIMMWTKSSPPNGWAICDGHNGTPDLTAQFIVGSTGAANTPITPSNPYPHKSKGGSTEFKVHTENLPNGFPKITDNGHVHNCDNPYNYGIVANTSSDGTRGLLQSLTDANSPSSKSYPYTTGSSKSEITVVNLGQGQNVKHVQPYYALYFIQKKPSHTV